MNEQKKILYIITKSKFGGAQKYLSDLSSNLKDTFKIKVAFGGHDYLEEKLEGLKIDTIHLSNIERDVNLVLDYSAFKEIYSVIKKEKPDILHLNSSKAGLFGCLAGRILRVNKIIFTAHGWSFNENRSFVSRVILIFLQWLTVILSHKTIAVSHKVKKDIAFMPFVKNKITVVHNGIESPDYVRKDIARDILGLNHQSYVIGTIAELHKSKGLDFLIKSFTEFHKDNPNTNLIIIGDGEEKNNLNKLIEELNIKPHVNMPGFVRDASRYLKAFDMFALTSNTEALGYVLMEAGLAQLPVVATRVGGIPEIIEDKVSGILIEKQSQEELVRGFKELYKKEKSSEYALNLKNKIVNNFSIKNMVQETVLIYTK